MQTKKTKNPKLGPKEKLEKALNIAAKELGVIPASDTPKSEVLPPVNVSRSTETRDDYNFTRKNLRDLAESANGAIESLMEVCEEGQEPRAFEVLAQLIKVSAEVTRELIHVQDQMRDIDEKDKENGQNPTVGMPSSITSADLLQMIKELPEGSK